MDSALLLALISSFICGDLRPASWSLWSMCRSSTAPPANALRCLALKLVVAWSPCVPCQPCASSLGLTGTTHGGCMQAMDAEAFDAERQGFQSQVCGDAARWSPLVTRRHWGSNGSVGRGVCQLFSASVSSKPGSAPQCTPRAPPSHTDVPSWLPPTSSSRLLEQ